MLEMKNLRRVYGHLPPIISAQGLSKRYGAVALFRSLSFTVSEGERIGIIGPNGSGKTTLLRAICNMLPWTGAIRLDGVPTNHKATHRLAREGVLHLPENRGILATQTVLENLQLAFDSYLDPALCRCG